MRADNRSYFLAPDSILSAAGCSSTTPLSCRVHTHRYPSALCSRNVLRAPAHASLSFLFLLFEIQKWLNANNRSVRAHILLGSKLASFLIVPGRNHSVSSKTSFHLESASRGIGGLGRGRTAVPQPGAGRASVGRARLGRARGSVRWHHQGAGVPWHRKASARSSATCCATRASPCSPRRSRRPRWSRRRGTCYRWRSSARARAPRP